LLDQQTEIDPRSKTTADKAFNLIGTGGPEEEVKGQGAVLTEKKRKSKSVLICGSVLFKLAVQAGSHIF